MPNDFVVGTDPGGERTMVVCADLAVPFAFPKQRVLFGVQKQTAASTDGARQTRWWARWSEVAVAYRVLLVLLLLVPGEIAVRRWFKRSKVKRITAETSALASQQRCYPLS